MIVCPGIVCSIDADGLWIMNSRGGRIRAPFVPGFQRGDKVDMLLNGPKTNVLDVFHRGEGVKYEIALTHPPISTAEQEIINAFNSTTNGQEEPNEWDIENWNWLPL